MAKAKETRVFRRTKEKIHDLYKLKAAEFLKNIAWQEKTVRYDHVTHCHYYHTIDSKGREQETSSHTGGHFHKIEVVEPATDTSEAKVKTSAPFKWANARSPDGSYQKVMVPFDKNDKHTHEVEYITSEKFIPRKTNMEAMKIITAEEQKVAPIPGIVG